MALFVHASFAHPSVVQALWSLPPYGLHIPDWHVPPIQAVPFATGLYTQPVGTHGAQYSVVQEFPSSQTLGDPGWQEPSRHTSPTVQLLPSSQDAVLLTCTQPVAALQLSVVQTLPSLQFTAVPTQTPPVHLSFVVQRLLSLQGDPLGKVAQLQPGIGVWRHVPVAPSQDSAVQESPSSQFLGAPGMQTLLTH